MLWHVPMITESMDNAVQMADHRLTSSTQHRRKWPYVVSGTYENPLSIGQTSCDTSQWSYGNPTKLTILVAYDQRYLLLPQQRFDLAMWLKAIPLPLKTRCSHSTVSIHCISPFNTLPISRQDDFLVFTKYGMNLFVPSQARNSMWVP